MSQKQKLLVLLFSPLIVSIYLINQSQKPQKPKEIAAISFVKCTSTKFLLDPIDSTKQIAPLFNDLGNHSYSISSSKKRAQAFFNQGLNLTYAFNHAEAHRAFLEATRLDNNMAMGYWGQAYALGPNINDQFPDEERRNKSYEAVQKALKLAANSTKKEQALIKALTYRYSNDSTDVKELNKAYMKAMTKVVKQYPNDADILTLYAASIMNTVPWDYWDKQGNPSPNIPEAKAALEKAIEINPAHPGAHHYYIHMVELPKPDLAVKSADILGPLMPGAGHMVHMPSHIYMRVGRYQDAVTSNQQAILADESYISQCYTQSFYPLSYYPHNIHFLWSAASMMGNKEIAISAAKKTAEKVPASELRESSFLQNFAITPLLAYTRFGMWNDILTTPNPSEENNYMQLIWNYSRGVAFCRKNNIKQAKEELESIHNRDSSNDDDRIGTVAKVAMEILAGEIAATEGNLDKAISHFESAVAFEDQLPYDEPSVWYIPTRQTLGFYLLKAKKYQKAESIYRQDLEYYRDNGWSLIGLHHSLIGQNKVYEAEMVKEKFEKVWELADIEINSSIL